LSLSLAVDARIFCADENDSFLSSHCKESLYDGECCARDQAPSDRPGSMLDVPDAPSAACLSARSCADESQLSRVINCLFSVPCCCQARTWTWAGGYRFKSRRVPLRTRQTA